MAAVIVSISDMKLATRAGDVLVTHSLGSCLGLAAYDPKKRVAGLIHCLLPTAMRGREQQNPYMFVNTGVPAMIRAMFAKGARRGNLVLKAAGCGRMMNVQNQFDTGANNLATLLRLLDKNGIELTAQDTGGTIPRTMYLHVDTGRVVIRSCGKEWEI
jgi:chemotaxis protein CheD